VSDDSHLAGEPGRRQRILLVEDDASIGPALSDGLRGHGYDTSWAIDGRAAMERVRAEPPDLVLLDLGLPEVDGVTLCRWIRELHPELPIIIVSARDDDIDVVVGLDAGASDYVTKPFSMPVLLARIRAHLRKSEPLDQKGRLVLGDVVIDPASHTLLVAGVLVDLRPKEFRLLEYFARQSGKVVSRERLLADVWDMHWDTSTKTVDMHIVALRRKVGDTLNIVTIRGVGYRLVLP
jgi:DNA-binding response OmpR family regulator